MRYVFAIIAVLMLLAAIVQYNDPDGPLWMVYYGVPAIWCGLAAFRPGLVIGSAGRALLGVSLAAALGLTAWYWPPVSGFWHETVWRMGMADPEAARLAEQAREGMGMMIVAAVLLAVAGWVFLGRASANRSGARDQPT
jgi:hypothetical protein